MKLRFERTKGNQTGLTITADKMGLIVGFSETTEGDHQKLTGSMSRFAKEQLKTAAPADIHFQWKRRSFFIFDSDIKELDKKMINSLNNYSGKLKWGAILNGQLVKKSPYNILVLNEDGGRTLSIMDKLQMLFDYVVEQG